MDEKFKKAVEKLLALEGGYVNNPDDPGNDFIGTIKSCGETKYGISKQSYPDLDIKNLTREQAIEIYFRYFWKEGGFKTRPYSEIQGQAVDEKFFDLMGNIEPKRAHELIRITVTFECSE